MDPIIDIPTFITPSTRYQGSKAKLIPWIVQCLEPFEFDTILDIFGGTMVVSYTFKRLGKAVTFNDYPLSNYYGAVALLKNATETLEHHSATLWQKSLGNSMQVLLLTHSIICNFSP